MMLKFRVEAMFKGEVKDIKESNHCNIVAGLHDAFYCSLFSVVYVMQDETQQVPCACTHVAVKVGQKDRDNI